MLMLACIFTGRITAYVSYYWICTLPHTDYAALVYAVARLYAQSIEQLAPQRLASAGHAPVSCYSRVLLCAYVKQLKFASPQANASGTACSGVLTRAQP
jgi:hypothetical protein